MKKKYMDEINDIENILKGKRNELQEILESDEDDKNIIYIEYLANDIEQMENNIKEIKIKNEGNDNIFKNKSFNEISNNKHINEHINVKNEEKKDLEIEKEVEFVSIKEKNNNLLDYIKNMEKDFNKNIEIIKKQLIYIRKEKDEKDINILYLGLIKDLNKISNKILLLKNNYIDIINN